MIGPAYVFCILQYSGLAFGPFRLYQLRVLFFLTILVGTSVTSSASHWLSFSFPPFLTRLFLGISFREVGADSAWVLFQELFWRIGLGKRKT